MRNEFVTTFWQRASESLPAEVRAQYLTQIKAAERWELALGDAIEFCVTREERARQAVPDPCRAHTN